MVDELGIRGCFLISIEKFSDLRGDLSPFWRKSQTQTLTGWDDFNPCQQNFVNSKMSSIRGIHRTRREFPQRKILTVFQGEIRDVLVDLRCESSTFLKSIDVHLTANSNQALLISERIGHSFQTLSQTSQVSYLMDREFSAEEELSINPFDPQIGINWLKPSEISDRDKNAEFIQNFEITEF